MNTKQAFKAMPDKKQFALGDRWQTRLARLNVGKWHKPLTATERGQLKNLANVLGPLTNDVIDWALGNWWKFSQKAESAAGLQTSPGEPHIGFLLTHCQVAVNQMQDEAEKLFQAKVMAEAREKVKQASSRLPFPKHEIYYPTDEEIAATLEGFRR